MEAVPPTNGTAGCGRCPPVELVTRPDQATQAVQVSREVVSRFALRIDSNRKLLDNIACIACIAWNNLPLDYLDNWTQQAEKVTVADIKAAFARKLQPEKMVTVVGGEVK